MSLHEKVKLAWKNLLKERCPKCECKLFFNAERKVYLCALNDGTPGLLSCDFLCTEKTMLYVNKYGIKDIEMENGEGGLVCKR